MTCLKRHCILHHTPRFIARSLPSSGGFTREGTPLKAREPSAFAKYVKEHFSELKKARPAASHGQIMSALGERWRAEGATPAKATPTAAKDTAPAAEEENLCSNLSSALDLAAADA